MWLYVAIRAIATCLTLKDIFKSLIGNDPFESTLTCESATSIIRKGNLVLERESHDYQALKKRRRDAIRLTMAKMERAQQVTYIAIAI